MAWVKIDDQAPRNEKMLKAGPAACWLWVCGIAHSQSQLTDGFVSFEALPMIGVAGGRHCARLAEALVQAGLFDRSDGGYVVHDYLDHNPSRVSVLARRAEDAARKRSESERTPTGIRADSNAPRARVPSHPIPSVPLPTEANTAFEQFWASYPKHTGRQACVRFWAQLSPTLDLTARILDGVRAYGRHVADWKPEYIKAPIRWLEGAHWDDELGGPDPKDYTWTCPHEPKCNARNACRVKTVLAESRPA